MNKIKEDYISPTTGRLLGVKLSNDLKNNIQPITDIIKNSPLGNTNQIIYNIVNNIIDTPTCENPSCSKHVDFRAFSIGYSRFCCIKCSKNPDELGKIDIFGGVHKIRTRTINDEVKYEYFRKTREITRITYKMYSDIINPNNYKLGLAGVDGVYQLDHIISVYEGYSKQMSPEYIGGVDNLRVIPWRQNAVKNKYAVSNDAHACSEYNKREKFTYSKFYDMDIDLFIYKYCMSKDGSVNQKINERWFKDRDLLHHYNEIINNTQYCSNVSFYEKLVFNLFKSYKIEFTINTSRPGFMRWLWNPTKDYVLLKDAQHEYDDYIKYVFKTPNNRFRGSRLHTDVNVYNRLGVLHLYYKYAKTETS